MAWEVFKRDKVPTGEPTVTITSMGRIALNKAAAMKLRDRKADNVELLWDADSSRAAIRPCHKQKGSYAIKYGDSSNGVGFSCTTFLNYIGYDWSETRNFPLGWENLEGMFVFELPVLNLGTQGVQKRRREGKRDSESKSKEQQMNLGGD